MLSTPKSGKVRSVPMAADVAEALARLGQRDRDGRRRPRVRRRSPASHLDASALIAATSAALERAGLRPLRFHDLRHTFGTRGHRQRRHPPRPGVDGHADIQTTMVYLHYAPRPDEADLIDRALGATPEPAVSGVPDLAGR